MAKPFPAPQPWLHTSGNKIQTSDGEQVILRGANLMRSEWGLDVLTTDVRYIGLSA